MIEAHLALFVTLQIPTQVGLATGLEYLILDSNGMTGMLPTELWALTTMKQIKLDDMPLEATVRIVCWC